MLTVLALLALAAAALCWPGTYLTRVIPGPGGCAAKSRPAYAANAREGGPYGAAAVFDVFAACLRAGLSPAGAAGAVATTQQGQVAAFFGRISNLLSLGVDEETAWTSAEGNPETDAFIRAAQRSARAGTPLAEAVSELAAELRQNAKDKSAEKAQRAGVLIAGPLGLCFLPSFMCLGIAPVVLGLAYQLAQGELL
ncbi:type II secretion system F family protein [Hoyosella subflava]|nr:type II secretion system F family protein [Hoyosella subflava]